MGCPAGAPHDAGNHCFVKRWSSSQGVRHGSLTEPVNLPGRTDPSALSTTPGAQFARGLVIRKQWPLWWIEFQLFR
jgi:hypothetical protein